ncbi:hypothetical protein GCM10023196_007130 [Actinoallomurus vinaceus]|uniref:Peptidase S1 domain-containing protein n=1 Tax=Actinoallomurus vinaceus TaxID=1080074 RepID=A0ABP8U0F8_9ACTN
MLHGALLSASLFSLAAPAAAADTHTVRAVSSDQDAARVTAYWTVARMAAATPEGPRPSGKTPDPAGPSLAANGGSRVVGALFYNKGHGIHFCTASVVHSYTKNIILTAGHCLYDPHHHTFSTNLAFVPGYNNGSRPYGVWPVHGKGFLDGRWLSHGDIDLDFGFARLDKVGGRHIEDRVGANTMRATQGFHRWVTVIGYPDKKYHHADGPISCSNWTFKHSTFQQGFDCGGYYNGTSGSPWVMNYNKHTQKGIVIGTLGGFQQGGATPSRSYSAVFDSDAFNLLVKADH